MVDVGLVVTGLLIVVILHVAVRWAPPHWHERREVLDALYGPAIVGVLAARLVAVMLDDPTSLGSIRALLVIRGGVEFWAGAAALLAVMWRGARRRHGRAWSDALVDLVPFVLWAYATYEATCVVRGGCYGPPTALGLVPEGLRERQLPVGLAVGAVVTVLGVVVYRLARWPTGERALLAVAGVATTRALASLWLPRLSDGLTRQHRESIVIAVVSLAALAASRWRTSAGATEPDPTGTTPSGSCVDT